MRECMRASTRRGRILGGAAFVVTALFAVSATAQTEEGFALNRFDPAERGSDWFWAESLDLRDHNRWAFGIVGDWARKPLVAYDSDGDESAALVKDQVYAHVGASAVFWERLRLGVSAPVLLYQDGEDVGVDADSFEAPSGAAVGDVRVGADLRLAGSYGDAATLALGGHVHLPTGSQEDYVSDGRTRLVPRLSLAGDIGVFTYALKSGFNFRRTHTDVAGTPFGTEWFFGGAAGFRLAGGAVTLGPEVWATTVVSDEGEGFFETLSTPVEGILGTHVKLGGGWRLGAGVGPGFNRGLGSPRLRSLLSLEWFGEPTPPPVAPKPLDSDGDGIFDSEDACVHEPGVENREDPSRHGCPLPVDTDGDGIFDPEDACVDQPGVPNPDDPKKHGCPIPDTDNDGILDPEDACIDEPGVPNPEDPSKHGCPLPKDRDGDGILDEEDACPDAAGVANADPAQHGCPRAQVVGTQVKILDRIEFDTNKATIRESSNAILEAVLKVLQDHPELKLIRVEGHTDDRGAAAYNRTLSQKRAAAVVAWLTERGVASERLTSQGKGEEAPIDSNETEDGRQNNRRVEFHIVQSDSDDATNMEEAQ